MENTWATSRGSVNRIAWGLMTMPVWCGASDKVTNGDTVTRMGKSEEPPGGHPFYDTDPEIVTTIVKFGHGSCLATEKHARGTLRMTTDLHFL